MKVVLIHGKDASPADKWYPWFINELKSRGIEVVAPVLPNADDPVMDEWLAELDKTAPNAETVLVGHSRGGVAVLRWLENQPEDFRVKKVILVATNSGDVADRHIPTKTNHGFYTEGGYDFEEIKTHCDDFIVMHSTDDKTVPFSNGEKTASGLGATFLKFDDKGHFGRLMPEFPELVDEIV